ncbi:MAG: hypothetical protein IJU95_02040 [Treponema sp.]|nr:hypothetical protein [Treponema sp.]
MGSLKIKGSLDGLSTVDCGMGEVKFDIVEPEGGHSVYAKVGLGSFEYDNLRKGGITTFESGEKKRITSQSTAGWEASKSRARLRPRHNKRRVL